MRTKSISVLALVGVAVAVAFGVAVAVTLLGGSGPSSRADYQASVVNARDRVDFALVRITKSQSTDELIQRIDEASVVIGDTASDLDDAGVAEGFETLNTRLLRTLRSFSDELAATSEQFSDPTFGPAITGITSLSFPQWNALNKILAQLKEQGLQVQQLPRH
jgi:hypothetical protein